MYLGFNMLAEIFPRTSGIKDPELYFHTVADNGTDEQPRGLFIPLWDNSQELKMAINNGAVAAIWEQDKPVPSYTPNHFPIFFTTNIWEDVIQMMGKYIQILKQEDERINMSNFLFLDEKLLNEKLKTYDKAVMYEAIRPLSQSLMDLRRG